MTPEKSAAPNANSADEMYQRGRLVALALVLLGAVFIIRFGAAWFGGY